MGVLEAGCLPAMTAHSRIERDAATDLMRLIEELAPPIVEVKVEEPKAVVEEVKIERPKIDVNAAIAAAVCALFLSVDLSCADSDGISNVWTAGCGPSGAQVRSAADVA